MAQKIILLLEMEKHPHTCSDDHCAPLLFSGAKKEGTVPKALWMEKVMPGFQSCFHKLGDSTWLETAWFCTEKGVLSWLKIKNKNWRANLIFLWQKWHWCSCTGQLTAEGRRCCQHDGCSSDLGCCGSESRQGAWLVPVTCTSPRPPRRAEAVCLPTEGSAGTYNTGFFFQRLCKLNSQQRPSGPEAFYFFTVASDSWENLPALSPCPFIITFPTIIEVFVAVTHWVTWTSAHLVLGHRSTEVGRGCGCVNGSAMLTTQKRH